VPAGPAPAPEPHLHTSPAWSSTLKRRNENLLKMLQANVRPIKMLRHSLTCRTMSKSLTRAVLAAQTGPHCSRPKQHSSCLLYKLQKLTPRLTVCCSSTHRGGCAAGKDSAALRVHEASSGNGMYRQ
jgi:hypothetical protein